MWARDYCCMLAGATLLAFACGKSTRTDSGDGDRGLGGTAGATSAGGSSGAHSGGTTGEPEGGEAGEHAGGAAGAGTCDEACSDGRVCHAELGCATVCTRAEPVLITSRAELEAFAAERCEVLEGSLTIRSDLTSLDALGSPSALRIVTGDLVIDQNPVLENLEGLAGLVRVGGSLVITANVIENLRGLHDLGAIGSDAELNTLVIADNPLLEDVSALGASLTSLLVSVVVADNAALTNLSGIDRLRAANNVSITNNPVLEELGGLRELEEAVSMTIASNASLLTLSLPGLASVGSLSITNHLALESVDLPRLAGAESLTIAGNQALTTLGTLDALESVGSLVIAGNPMLPQCFVDALDARLDACDMRCGGNDTAATCE